MRNDQDQTAASSGALKPESQSWVNASLRKSRLNWRELVIKGLHYSGALGLARRIARSREILPGALLPWPRFRAVQGPRFAILCYHGIGESGNPLLSAPTREAFDAQMRFLSQRYRVVSLSEVCEGLRNPQAGEPGVAITFDDGYRSVYTAAFPILQKYGLTATVYLTHDTVETGEVAWYDRVFLAMAVAPNGEVKLDFDGPWSVQLDSLEDRLGAALEVVAYLRALPNSRRLEYCALLEKKISLPKNELSGKVLTWQQIHTMQYAGISFGSHTLTHPVISSLTPAELAAELGDSKRRLEEKLGGPVVDFAFPFGKESDCSAAATHQLAGCGYRSAVTTIAGANAPPANLLELRRLQVGDDESLARFAYELSQAFLRPEAPRALNTQRTELVLGQNDPGLNRIGGAFGGPHA